MDTCILSVLDHRRHGRTRAGFSLVEVTLAIGIVAFAFVAVFGMLPTGLGLFRETMNTAVGSEIAQRVINEAKQADFTVLTQGATGTAGETLRKPLRYFDVQGDELITANGAATPPAGTVYQVNTRIMPVTAVPSASNNVNLALVTIQIAYNPGGQSLPVTGSPNDSSQPLRNLWSSGAGAGSPPSTWSTLVARNN